MPATRSSRAKKIKKSRAQGKPTGQANGSAPVLSNISKVGQTPSVDSSSPADGVVYAFKRVRGDIIGLPLKSAYSRKVQPEFTEHPSVQGIRAPVTAREPPLCLKDLECIRTLGMEAEGRVLLTSSRRTKDRLQSGDHPYFAVKAIRRKKYRKDAATLATPAKPPEGQGLKKMTHRHFESQGTERSILVDLPWNPFVAGLIQTFQDSQALYMALEFIPGGTLRSLLRKSSEGLGNKRAFFYYANLVCALEFLREEGIAHRDLRPENIALGPDGYLCLTDFGAATKFDNRKCSWNVGTRAYAPPECLLLPEGPSKVVPEAVDWWSSGCILYEMVTGEMALFEDMAQGSEIPRTAMGELRNIRWPLNRKFGLKLMDLVRCLLEVDPEKRLGTQDVNEVRTHDWFKTLDWTNLKRRKYLAPDVPKQVNQSQVWHHLPLPKQEYIPGLKIMDPFLHLAHDNRFPERPIPSS